MTDRPNSGLRRLLRVLLPFVVIAIAGTLAYLIYELRPETSTEKPTAPSPLVKSQELQSQTCSLSVRATGTVRPQATTTLVAEVTGKVIEVSEAFETGAFFQKGDVLARLDPRDYELAQTQAKSRVMEAQSALQLEQAEAESLIEDWNSRSPEVPPPPLVRREPQLAAAEAQLAAASASLESAQRDVERTTIRAPFSGRVRSREVDLGQFVSRGTPLGTLLGTEFVEVRLPLQDRDLAFVDLPLTENSTASRTVAATVEAEFAGTVHRWQGRVARTEAEVDPETLMLHAIVRVDAPYATVANGSGERPPLLVGTFVDVSLPGRSVEGFIVPRAAIRGADTVLLIDDEDRLRPRKVEVFRVEGDNAVVVSGLASGERLCATRLEVWSDGMHVRVLDSQSGADR